MTTYFRYKCRNCGAIERRVDYRKKQDAVEALSDTAAKNPFACRVVDTVLHLCRTKPFDEMTGIADLIGVEFDTSS